MNKTWKDNLAFFTAWIKNTLMILGFFTLGYLSALLFQNIHQFLRGTIELMSLWIITALVIGLWATKSQEEK